LICNCGLNERKKQGTFFQDDVEYCGKCRRPLLLGSDAIARAAATRTALATMQVTTLQTLPGFRITAVRDVVSVLSGSSGFTATTKGNDALAIAMKGLRQAAADIGGNAIVGLTGSTFGAGGGVTSVFGGDAVGVLLMGTAVTVEPVTPPAGV
jgi:uncharacterized protein YbjQ (UPF0145 family)